LKDRLQTNVKDPEEQILGNNTKDQVQTKKETSGKVIKNMIENPPLLKEDIWKIEKVTKASKEKIDNHQKEVKPTTTSPKANKKRNQTLMTWIKITIMTLWTLMIATNMIIIKLMNLIIHIKLIKI